MSATVTYKGATLTTATNQTRVLETEGTYLEDDITITDVTTVPTGTKNISITSNGTTTEDVTNYASASITANVPNSYTSSDEGKVVSNGSLVSQTSATYTANDTYDTTTINSVTVNVSGGGGGGLFNLLETITVPTDTRAVNVDISSYSSYNLILILEDVTLSASDWLYYVKNGSTPSGGTYNDGSFVVHKGICAIRANTVAGGTRPMSFIAQGSNLAGQGNDDMSNLYIYTYSSSKSITAGSKFYIYGGNYADM